MTSLTPAYGRGTDPRVLADVVLPRGALGNAIAVTGFVAFVGLAAQIAIPLPFTPVPLTLQTFAVLIGAAVVGPARGVVAMTLYLALGAVGLPLFAGGARGLEAAFGATFGYLLGFVIAAFVVGRLADERADRRPGSTLVAYGLGSLAIYLCGAGWLMVSMNMSVLQALGIGVLPFLPGDLIKALAAACLLPSAWGLVQRAGRL